MIKENKLNVGDRVQSTIAGYYFNAPGTVLEEKDYSVSNQPNVTKEYMIELDTGEVLTMKTSNLERVEGANK